MITADIVRELLDYDHVTGSLRWRQKRGRMRAESIAGRIDPDSGYVEIRINMKKYWAHRIAWLHFYGALPAGQIDHRDTCRSNNAILNLRDATRYQNKGNMRRSRVNTSGYKGVCFDKQKGKYRADIKIKGKNRYLGAFDDPKEAHEAYCRVAHEAFGEFFRPA